MLIHHGSACIQYSRTGTKWLLSEGWYTDLCAFKSFVDISDTAAFILSQKGDSEWRSFYRMP